MGNDDQTIMHSSAKPITTEDQQQQQQHQQQQQQQQPSPMTIFMAEQLSTQQQLCRQQSHQPHLTQQLQQQQQPHLTQQLLTQQQQQTQQLLTQQQLELKRQLLTQQLLTSQQHPQQQQQQQLIQQQLAQILVQQHLPQQFLNSQPQPQSQLPPLSLLQEQQQYPPYFQQQPYTPSEERTLHTLESKNVELMERLIHVQSNANQSQSQSKAQQLHSLPAHMGHQYNQPPRSTSSLYAPGTPDSGIDASGSPLPTSVPAPLPSVYSAQSGKVSPPPKLGGLIGGSSLTESLQDMNVYSNFDAPSPVISVGTPPDPMDETPVRSRSHSIAPMDETPVRSRSHSMESQNCTTPTPQELLVIVKNDSVNEIIHDTSPEPQNIVPDFFLCNLMHSLDDPGLKEPDTRWMSLNHLAQVVHYVRRERPNNTVNELAKDSRWPSSKQPKTTHWLNDRLKRFTTHPLPPKTKSPLAKYTVGDINRMFDDAATDAPKLRPSKFRANRKREGPKVKTEHVNNGTAEDTLPKINFLQYNNQNLTVASSSANEAPAHQSKSKKRSHTEISDSDFEDKTQVREIHNHMCSDTRPSDNFEMSSGDSAVGVQVSFKRCKSTYDPRGYLEVDRRVLDTSHKVAASIGWTVLYGTNLNPIDIHQADAQKALDLMLVYVKMLPRWAWRDIFGAFTVDQAQFKGEVVLRDGMWCDKIYIRVEEIDGVHASATNSEHCDRLDAFDVNSALRRLYLFGTAEQLQLADQQDNEYALMEAARYTPTVMKHIVTTAKTKLDQKDTELENLKRQLEESQKQQKNLQNTTQMLQHMCLNIIPPVKGLYKNLHLIDPRTLTESVQDLGYECQRIDAHVNNTIMCNRLLNSSVAVTDTSIPLHDMVVMVVKYVNTQREARENLTVLNEVNLDVAVFMDKQLMFHLLSNMVTACSPPADAPKTSVVRVSCDRTATGECRISVRAVAGNMQTLGGLYKQSSNVEDVECEIDSNNLQLAICQQLLERHGGGLHVSNQCSNISFTTKFDTAKALVKSINFNDGVGMKSINLEVVGIPSTSKSTSSDGVGTRLMSLDGGAKQLDTTDPIWFVGEMGRTEAWQKLFNADVGKFLVRIGTSGFVISVVYGRDDVASVDGLSSNDALQRSLFNVVIQTMVDPDNTKWFYVADNGMFRTIPSLIQHYMEHPDVFFNNLTSARKPTALDRLIPLNGTVKTVVSGSTENAANDLAKNVYIMS